MRAALIMASVLVLAACNFSADAQERTGESGRSGQSGQRSFDVGGFDAVSAAGAYDVVVTVGPAASVRAEGDADELERMEIRVENGTLKIGRQRERGFMSGWKNKGPVTVYVSVPALRAASLAGAGDMTIDRIEGQAFNGSIAGAGDMKIGLIRVAEARFDIAGAGNMTATGSAARSEISIAGAGDVNMEGVESRTAKVSIAGSGDVRARATETADISIVGSGDVTLGGGARCNVSKLGAGEVRCVA